MSAEEVPETETETESESDVAATEEAGRAGAFEEEDVEQVDVVHAPPRLTQLVALAGVLIGAALTTPFMVLTLPFGLAGVLIVAASVLATYSLGWLAAGTGLVLVGTLIAGAYGALPPEILLTAVAATIVGWDAGQHGIVLGEQLGRQTRSRRTQIVHVAASTLAVTLISGFAYLVYLFGAGGRPAPAVSLAVVGAVILTWLYRS